MRNLRADFIHDGERGMPTDTAMTGTFQANLPSDLLSAVQHKGAAGHGNDLTVRSMKPSLMERLIGIFVSPKPKAVVSDRPAPKAQAKAPAKAAVRR